MHEFQLANVRQLRGKLSVPVGSIGLKVLGCTVVCNDGFIPARRSTSVAFTGKLVYPGIDRDCAFHSYSSCSTGKMPKRAWRRISCFLVLALPALKEVRFKSENESLKQAMLDQAEIFQPDSNRMGELPAPVQAWLLSHAGGHLSGKRYVSLKQTGSMRSKTDGKWVPFQAEQTVTCNPAAFQWSVPYGHGARFVRAGS